MLITWLITQEIINLSKKNFSKIGSLLDYKLQENSQMELQQ